jgi:hypothetical protein
MSALTEFLFPAPAKRTAGAIIGWWEKRRLAYNVAVGSSGVISIGISWLLHALPPSAPSFGLMPWQPIVVFGVLANVFYLLGPVSEFAIEKLWGREVLPTGPVLYRMGLTFALGLTMIPVLMSSVYWVARVVMAIF